MRPTDAFAPIREVAALLSAFDRPWWIAGGWAIDLFLRRVTRDHDDVDVAILRQDQGAIRAYLAAWEFDAMVDGRRVPCRGGEWLTLPVHEIHGRRSAGTPRKIEILLNDAANDDWVFRRDARITRPLADAALRDATGIPFFGPEIVLLYKAKDPRPKDAADFAHARPRLGFRRRGWLRGALETCHPGHPWIARL